MPAKKLILRSPLTTGDIVMMTAAVRDLHRCYPGRFITDVRTFSPELWEHNPYITALRDADGDVRVLDCDYPLIERSDREPYHCLHGFMEFLNDRLHLRIRPTVFRGDIHLSASEKAWCSQVYEELGTDLPFWIVSAGGKYDVTTKWWDPARYQAVVDHFRGRIQFVQIGDWGHHHPRLEGVLDLRGRTDLRQLIRLVYHAQGVLGPVTALMHLAAAVEVRDAPDTLRPCVVIAGGREPVHWEAYPGHQFVHTVGALSCCRVGGCWKDRTVPLGDGDWRDRPEHRCLDVHGHLPRCLDLITADEVIRRIELYFAGGALQYLRSEPAETARLALQVRPGNPYDNQPLKVQNVRQRSEDRIRSLPDYPGGYDGRGCVICAGGVTHFVGAWVCINTLRHHGCHLPIEVWHLGREEFDPEMEALLTPLGVKCVDAQEVRKRHPVRLLGGWELKPFALIHSAFREVLLIDADNIAVRDPTYLFDEQLYRSTGAMFWPDLPRNWIPKRVWDFCGITPPDTVTFETGQILVDKERCWRPLNLALWYNEHSDFFYEHIHGDKETFHLAFRKLAFPYAMPATPVHQLWGTLCQQDPQGRRLFQHRNMHKWTLFHTNPRIRDYRQEAECLDRIERLRQCWDGRMARFEPLLGINGARRTLPATGEASPKLLVLLLSVGNREATLTHTAEALRATDWPHQPIAVRVTRHPRRAFADAASLAFQEALGIGADSDADYVVLVEGDSKFNRHLYHNLRHWTPLNNRTLKIGVISNVAARAKACSVRHSFSVADSYTIYGGTSWVLARPCMQQLLEQWPTAAVRPDMRLAHLAGRLGWPVLVHSPSLTQRAGSRSPWPGSPARSLDYSWQWKAQTAL